MSSSAEYPVVSVELEEEETKNRAILMVRWHCGTENSATASTWSSRTARAWWKYRRRVHLRTGSPRLQISRELELGGAGNWAKILLISRIRVAMGPGSSDSSRYPKTWTTIPPSTPSSEKPATTNPAGFLSLYYRCLYDTFTSYYVYFHWIRSG
jgi:hypothetical protein